MNRACPQPDAWLLREFRVRVSRVEVLVADRVVEAVKRHRTGPGIFVDIKRDTRVD